MKPLPVTSLLKRATESVCLLQIVTAQIDTCACIYSDKKSVFRQTRHWQWRVYTKTSLTVTRLHKDATDSGAFAQRYCQWRAAIRRFKILFLSLLLLII
jgi:hypothetical protein